MDYNEIPRVLKRYSFEEKMRVLNTYSRQLLNVEGNANADNFNNRPYPWELETILLFSLKATPEYANQDFKNRNINKFIEIVNTIRNFQHPSLSKACRTDDFANYVLTTLGLCQFDIQEHLPYKYYRYKYFFEFNNESLNMKKIFEEKFGVSYYEFIKLSTLLNILYSSFDELSGELLSNIVLKYFPKVCMQLAISLEEHNKMLDCITKDQNDYLYCLRPSYKYPFILKDSIAYIPLPHLFGRSVTTSLLYRITENDNQLRTMFGKEVLESYIYKLLCNSLVYDEIIKEQEYLENHKNKVRTLDVMMRVKNKFLLLDCKSTVPKIGLRIFDKKSYESMIDILTDSIVQVYKHISKKVFIDYDFFDYKDNVNMDNVYGAVVVLEDSYIRRDLLYKKAAEKLFISVDTIEYDWFVNHVKLVDLYNVERISMLGISLIDIFEKQENYSDYPLVNIKLDNSKIINKEYLKFKDEWLDSMDKLSILMYKDGIINK